MLQEVVPEGFVEGGIEYDLGMGGESAMTCFSVVLEEEPEFPLRLAFAAGDLGASGVQVFDLVSGTGYYPTITVDNCDASEPTWWPDEAWVVYQSSCMQTETSEGWLEWSPSGNYDLVASMLDPTYTLPEDEKLIRLTNTPEMNETEADVNADGLIVYRQTPLDGSLDAVGDLRVLDIFENTDTALGIAGRAPAWSPDGTRIAFMSDAALTSNIEGSWQIYLYDLEDDEIRLVSRNCATHCRLPAWSPNGRQIIYHASVSLEDLTPQGLWIASVTGISRPRLFLEGEFGRPSWSSDGWITFQGPDGIYRTTMADEPVVERYLLSSTWATFWAPEWSH
jgi:Tol biopolymer transport system component